MARVSTRVSTTSVTQMNGVNNGGGTNSGASSGNTKNGWVATYGCSRLGPASQQHRTREALTLRWSTEVSKVSSNSVSIFSKFVGIKEGCVYVADTLFLWWEPCCRCEFFVFILTVCNLWGFFVTVSIYRWFIAAWWFERYFVLLRQTLKKTAGIFSVCSEKLRRTQIFLVWHFAKKVFSLFQPKQQQRYGQAFSVDPCQRFASWRIRCTHCRSSGRQPARTGQNQFSHATSPGACRQL